MSFIIVFELLRISLKALFATNNTIRCFVKKKILSDVDGICGKIFNMNSFSWYLTTTFDFYAVFFMII